MNNTVLSRFTQPVINLLLGRTAVYTDALRGVEQVKSSGSFGYSAKLPSSIDCLILGKEHYSESCQSYPIQSAKEVRNILSLEAQNSEQLLMYVIGPYTDGKRSVVTWRIEPQVLEEHHLTPMFIIPESALLLANGLDKLISVERAGRTFWFSRRQDQYICAEKKGLIANEMMFLASAGLSEQIEQLSLDSNDYLGHIFAQLPQVLFSQWQGLKVKSKGLGEIDWMSHFKYSGVAGAALVIGYLGLSSLYLNVRLESVKGQSSELAEQTRDVFALQSDFNRLQEQLEGFSTVANVQYSSNVVWRLVGPLAKQGVKLERIMMLPDGLFILNMEAKSAVEVLNFISKDDGVTEAKFRGETNSSNGKEQFAVSFKAATLVAAQDKEV